MRRGRVSAPKIQYYLTGETEDLPWPTLNAFAALLSLCCENRQNWLSHAIVSPARDGPVVHSASGHSMRLTLLRFLVGPRNLFTLAIVVTGCASIFAQRAVRQSIGSPMRCH